MVATHSRASAIDVALSKSRMSAPQVSYFMFSAIAALLVVAGVITTFFAATGVIAAPLFFLVVAIVLAIFSPGYVAMARHIVNAGAFYAFISKGLGKPTGVAAALVAVIAYNMLQVAVYGLFGPSMASWAADHLGWHLAWWNYSLIAWAAVTILGVLKVRISTTVLAALSVLEIIVIVIVDVIGLAHPSPAGISLGSVSPSNLIGPASFGLIMGVLGYIGFESAPIFGEEARDHRRTIAIATYFTLGLITVVYILSAVSMLTHYGSDQVATVAQQQGPDMFLKMANGIVASTVAVLFLTSMFAALLAFHNFVGRYMFSLGREHVLPQVFARTGQRSGAPWVASLSQSTLALAVIAATAYFGWDPIFKLFFWISTTGGFGVLVLLVFTSVAVVFFFARDAYDETPWRRAIAPSVAALLLAGMVYLTLQNYATLLGIPEGSLAAKLLPASYLVPVVVGLVWAAILRTGRPEIYSKIGLGPAAVGR